MGALLQQGEESPFIAVNEQGRSPFVLICEHASNTLPRSLGTLGLSDEDLQRHIAEAHGIALGQPTGGLESLETRPAILGTRGRQLVDPEAIVDVRPLDRDAMPARVLGRSPAMIDMPVGDQHFLQLRPGLRQTLVDLVEVSTGVDGNRCAAGLVDQNRAVLLKRRDRYDHELHGYSLMDSVRVISVPLRAAAPRRGP